MVRKLSLFLGSLFFPFPHLFPHRRQQLMNLLEEVAEDVPVAPCCEDILEIWVEEFDIGGLLLGNTALFAVGLLLMIGADLLTRRWSSAGISLLIGSLSTAYCLFKFHSGKPFVNLLILLLCLYWLISGFWWSIAFVFLVYYTNTGVRYARGGNLC